MDEVYGETEDFIARAIQEMSNKKKISFQDIMRQAPAMDPSRVFGIMQQMENFGAVKSKQPFWGVSRGADPGPFYRVNPQTLARYRENYAAPPPYEQKEKPLPRIPTDKPLPARPTISPQEAVQNLIRKDSERMTKYQASELAKSLDWPIRKFPTFSGEASKSIARAASQRASGIEGARREQKNPGTANGNHSNPYSAQPSKRRAR
ncbi:hypothetical protein [Streptomyces sp. NPDC004589]|uniref:hypothetical protein n=1 Tax=Streptomyces sp. NPDC004589 TaxID=3154553 RepID=UPI0033A07574